MCDAVQALNAKKCTVCEQLVEFSCFYKDRYSKDGMYSECMNCFKRRMRYRYYFAKPKFQTDLYIFENLTHPGVIKIGKSINPERRRKRLCILHKTVLVLRVVYPGSGHKESQTHHDFDACRVTDIPTCKGREWYRIGWEDVHQRMLEQYPDIQYQVHNP